jgi:MFS family permease
MIRVDICIVTISIPSISRCFCATTGEVACVSLVCLLCVPNTMLLFGRLEDRLGPRRMLLLGYSIFLISSFHRGVSTSFSMLIAGRCLQSRRRAPKDRRHTACKGETCHRGKATLHSHFAAV